MMPRPRLPIVPADSDFSPAPEPVPFVASPAVALPRHADVVVVGAGLIGASAAYRLAAAGTRPLVIEANAPASGASGRNAGMVLQGLGGHFPRVSRLVREAGGRSILDYTSVSVRILEELEDRLAGGFELERSGSLDLFLSPEELLLGRAAAAEQRAEGLDVEIIGPRDVAELEPELETSRLLGARWTPSDRTLNPFKLTYRLLEASISAGATVLTGVRVEELLERSGAIRGVRTSHGDVESDAVLLATNAWTGALAPQLAANLTPIREHVCVTAPVAPVMRAGFETNRCNEYWRQMRSGEVVIGGYAVADEHMGIGTYSVAVHSGIPPRLAALLGTLFPRLADVPILRCWAGLLDFASLEIPMVGRLPDAAGRPMPGGYVACGLTGHGMPYAPIFGVLLAELICHGEARTLPLAPFDPVRYVGTAHPPTWLEPFGATAAMRAPAVDAAESVPPPAAEKAR